MNKTYFQYLVQRSMQFQLDLAKRSPVTAVQMRFTQPSNAVLGGVVALSGRPSEFLYMDKT